MTNKNEQWEDYLHNIYYNVKHPASFSGPSKLYHEVKKDGKKNISMKQIKQWLQNQESYSLQRFIRRNFKRSRVMVTGIDDQWDADLIDMAKYSQYNDNITFILIVIDVFSKYVWLRKLPNKTGKEVSKAFKTIFKEGRKPSKLRTDKGWEFLHKPTIQKIFKEYKIKHFVTQNEVKANVAERAIKTIKSKIMRYITYKQNYHFIDELQNFATSYNATFHRSIGMSPDRVNKNNEVLVWWNLYWPKKNPKKHSRSKKFTFEIGDFVRMTHLRKIFGREYDKKWTGQLFKIAKRYIRDGSPIYKVKDFHGDEIKGTFYPEELQKVTVDHNKLWKVDQILKTRKRKGKTEYLVRWMYWPKSFDSWVNKDDVELIS